MKAAIYCRVSTKEQVRNFSLATQQRECRQYCARHDVTVAAEFIEEGESAKTADRPELQRMLEYCRKNKGRIQWVVVYSVSRLARENHDHYVLRALLNKLGITLRSVSEPIDDSPTGRFVEGVLAAAAQFDNDVKAQRTRAGMMAAARAGRWTHQAPLGYKSGPKPGPSLIPDPERAELIRAAFKLRLEGNDEPAVLRRLSCEGLRGRKGNALSKQTLSAILRNPVYAARIDFPRWEFVGPGDWEALISADVFEQVQRLRRTDKRRRVREHPDFPLRLFVRCGLCSTPLTGSRSKGRTSRYAYYSCRDCGKVRARKEKLEQLFVDRLHRLQPGAAYMKLFNAIVLDVWKERGRESRKLAATLHREREAITQRLDSLDRAFIWERRIDRTSYERLRDKLREDQALLDMREHAARVEELDVEGLVGFAELVLTDAARLWSEATASQKQKLQRVFFPRGMSFDGEQFGTAATCLAFREIREIFDARNGVASPTGFEPVF